MSFYSPRPNSASSLRDYLGYLLIQQHVDERNEEPIRVEPGRYVSATIVLTVDEGNN
jgi:hypothetical protein